MSHRKALVLILVISVLGRLAVAIYFGDRVENLPGTNDQISYHALALRVVEGYGFSFGENWWPVTHAGAPTAHWSFLYTFFLAGVYALFGPHPIVARILQAVIVGLLHPWLVYSIGRRVFTDTVGLAAAGLSAVYIYFLYYSGTLMTEPFYITAILASLYLAMRLVDDEMAPAVSGKAWMYRTGIGLGLTLGAAVLLRQLFLLVIPFIFLWILWKGGKSRFMPLVISGLIIAAAIIPFTIFNYSRFHRFVLLNTNAGYAFYWGNHPVYGDKFIPILPSEVYLKLIPRELSSLDEAALDQALLGRAMQIIREDPVRYIKLSVSRIPAYFMFWPTNESTLISNLSRVLSFGILWPFMLAGLMLFLLRKWRSPVELLKSPGALLALFSLVYTLIHLLTWALIRYRLPVDAVLLVFAGLALVTLFEWAAARRQVSNRMDEKVSKKVTP